MCGEKSEVQRFCSGDEELNRAAAQDVVWLFLADGRHFERRHAIDVLAVDAQHFAARRQNCCARAKAHESLHEVRHCVDDVLAIVQDQEKVAAADGACHSLAGNLSAAEFQPKRAGHRGRHEVGIGQRRQLDKPAAVLKLTEDAAGDLQREGGLPDATWPRQGHNPIGSDNIP